jgi:hypothetical protein
VKKDITGEDVIDAREASGDVCNRVLQIMQRATRIKRKFTRRFRKDSKKKGGAA